MDYCDFIKTKEYQSDHAGFEPDSLNSNLKPHQRDIVNWACRRGKAGIFADTGLGKTLMQLEWANQVSCYTGKPVLIVAPLAVGKQTEGEAKKFNIGSMVKYMREPDFSCDIHVTNYEMISYFNPEDYAGIVLDESSILKGQTGAYRKMLTEFASGIPYRLSCTATPSPNDFMELGTQCEFLGIISQVEMLSMFFTHDGSETQKWRLKGWGASKFWEWLATWAVVISSPADLGYDGSEYDLPELEIVEHVLPAKNHDGLFADIAQGMGEARKRLRSSIDERVKACAEWVNSLDEPCLVWGELNAETDALEQEIDDCVQVKGSDKQEVKEDRLLGFASGKYEKMISKSKICGFGMNYQHSCKMAFAGPTYSFESFYQAVRRQYRFGQTKSVEVRVFMTEEETGIHSVMMQKMQQDRIMRREMIKVMSESMRKEIKGAGVEKAEYNASVKADLPCFV